MWKWSVWRINVAGPHPSVAPTNFLGRRPFRLGFSGQNANSRVLSPVASRNGCHRTQCATLVRQHARWTDRVTAKNSGKIDAKCPACSDTLLCQNARERRWLCHTRGIGGGGGGDVTDIPLLSSIPLKNRNTPRSIDITNIFLLMPLLCGGVLFAARARKSKTKIVHLSSVK